MKPRVTHRALTQPLLHMSLHVLETQLKRHRKGEKWVQDTAGSKKAISQKAKNNREKNKKGGRRRGKDTGNWYREPRGEEWESREESGGWQGSASGGNVHGPRQDGRGGVPVRGMALGSVKKGGPEGSWTPPARRKTNRRVIKSQILKN